MSESERPERAPDPEAPKRLEGWLRPLLEDSLLWPVLATFLLCAASVGAAAIIAALQQRNVFAMAALAIAATATVFGLEEGLRRRRLDTLRVLVLAIWLLSALGALALHALAAYR
jgi:hypothetical protein